MDTLHIFYSFQIHGTADDNVHYQQSMVFAKALSQKGALFKQQIYPDEGHSLSGVRRHLYRTMTLFFEDCFKKLVNIDEKKKLKKNNKLYWVRSFTSFDFVLCHAHNKVR
jgi:hypothetical protein